MAAGPVFVSGCGGGNASPTNCTDGVDNDGDGRIDSADSGCLLGDNEAADAGTKQCSNGIDDDGDGQVDFPADVGCINADDDAEDSAAAPHCMDNRDNDGDGLKDYPEDPGCVAPNQDDESDDCPTGPNCPACSNGADDDGDGMADFPADTGCDAASDTDEFVRDPAACGAAVTIQDLPANRIATGLIAQGSTSNMHAAGCGGAGTSQESVYEIRVRDNRVLVATTESAATNADTVLYLRSAACAADGSEMACNDDAHPATKASTLTANLTPGVYYLVVDGNGTAPTGGFEVAVKLLGAEGSVCTTANDCGPSLTCRVVDGQAGMVCAKHICNDGLDNDGDGKIDFPLEPGCTSPTDADETDTCPGAGCPACGNGTDDDGDGATDYPADIECGSAAQATENACPAEMDALTKIVGATTVQTISTTTHNDIAPSCATVNGLDRAFTATLPGLKSLTATTTGSGVGTSLSLSVWNATCSGPELACKRDFGNNTVTMTDVAPGVYVFVTDSGSTTATGSVRVNLSGIIAAGNSCESPLFTAGVLACDAGTTCKGTAGARTCQASACNDLMDNDGDGKMDFPNEPGCQSVSDDDETDTCPGAGCPACADGQDNDGDTMIDFPLDTACTSAAANNEACTTSEPIGAITAAVTNSSTLNATNDVNPGCGSSAGTGPDLTYQLDLPPLTTLTIAHNDGTNDYDAVVALLPSSCGLPAVSCQDFSNITLTNVAAGRYFYVVDGYSATAKGALTTTISGKIAPNGSCEVPLALAGALTCADGSTCKGTAGARTCQPAACADMVDADGDGKPGFPTDPGCSSPSDDDETDMCPNGPGCPACSDGRDNDNDGRSDYPADGACRSAGGTSEANCPQEADLPLVRIAGPTTTGTTVGKANNLSPTCGSSTAPEVTYELVLNVPVLILSVDTENSALDTVVSVRDEACNSPDLKCDDDSGVSGGSSKLEMVDVQPGAYMISVDGYSTNAGTFSLNVRGEVASGTACTGPLFTANVLSCVSGTTCQNGTCQ